MTSAPMNLRRFSSVSSTTSLADWITGSDMDTRILVLDRGFVVIALVEKHPDRAFWLRCRSRTIRVWGTTKGLAELVAGPTAATKLDGLVVEDIPMRAILREIHAEEE